MTAGIEGGDQSPGPSDEEQLCRTAAIAYVRTGGTEHLIRGGSLVTHNKARYVVLRGASGFLAVYQLMASGALQRLREWPRAIEAM